MLTFLEFQNFRGFESVRLEPLGRANLIVGGNNVGKTSVLEALVLLFGYSQLVTSLASLFRHGPSHVSDERELFWNMLANARDPNSFRLRSNSREVITRELADGWALLRGLEDKFGEMLRIEKQQLTHQIVTGREEIAILSTSSPDPGIISQCFNEVAPANAANEERIERLLRDSIEPRLRRLRYHLPRGAKQHLVYVDLGIGPMLPFTQMGQAFARTLHVYSEIFANRPQFILIDEIENGLYHEGLEDYWRGLLEVLEDQDVQLFATTHSRECMEAAHRAASQRQDYPLRYLRLDRREDDPDRIVGTSFGQQEMQTAIESRIEMR